MLDYKSNDFKSLEELRLRVPSIFTTTGANSTSEKYSHIPTDKVIKDMETLGWFVNDAKEVKARFQFTAGLFRMICENGLVVSTETFNDFKVRHMGYDFEKLQGVIKEMTKALPLTVESMNKMKSVELKEEQLLDFAKSLLEVRVKGTENTIFDDSLDQVLFIQRKADKGLGLWEVFNRVQENIVEGNFEYKTRTGKRRFARPIKNFKQDIKMNQGLFEKALEYIV